MPRPKSVKPVSTVKKIKPVKKNVLKPKKTAIDKINATVAKWDSGACPDYIKLGTADYLSLLATTLEKGEAVHLSYNSPCGKLAVLPRKPKELLNAARYLQRQATLGDKVKG